MRSLPAFRPEVRSPCSEDVGAMRAVGRDRHCEKCDRTVVQMSKMTEMQARAWAGVFGASGFCGSIQRYEDGEPIFRAEKPTPRRGRSLLAGAATALAACGTATTAQPPVFVEVASDKTEAPEKSTPTELVVVSASPPKDADGDGIVDAEDFCPSEVGVSRGERPGCPDTRRVIIQSSGDMMVMQSLEFTKNGDVLPKWSPAYLDEVATLLKSNPQIDLLVEGHTSTDEPRGDALGLRRAKTTVAALVKRGIDPKRLVPVSKGALEPIDVNTTPEGREHNRRVRFTVVPPP